MAKEKIEIDVLIEAAQSAKTVGELKKSLKDLKSAALDAGQGSEAFNKYTKAAALAGDRIDDVNESIRALNPDKKIGAFISLGQSIAGSFAVASGAVGLFGDSNEDAQKAILKVQSAVAILSGIQSIADAKREAGLVKQVLLKGADNAQQVISNGLQSSNIIIQKAATVGQWALNAAMSANPIGLIITGITVLIGAYALFSKAAGTSKEQVDKSTESFKRHREELDRIGNSANSAAAQQLKLAEAQGADEEIIRQKKITAARVAADGIDAQIFANKMFREQKWNEYKRTSDEELQTSIRKDIQDSYDADIKLWNGRRDLYNQLTVDLTASNTKETNKKKEKNKKDDEEAKQRNEEIKKNNLEINKQILEIQNEGIQNEQLKQIEKLELDAKFRKRDIDNLKADLELKKKLKAEIDKKLATDTTALEITFKNEASKTILETDLINLEKNGESTLKKRIEIAQFERDIIINSTKATQEEKLKATADYQKKEKDLLENGIKDLQDKINQFNKNNTQKQGNNPTDEFIRRKAELVKLKNEELDLIAQAEKKYTESQIAQGVDAQQALLNAQEKFAGDRLNVERKYTNQVKALQKDLIDDIAAQYASYVTSALNSIQQLLDARDDKERNALEKQIKENDRQYDIRNKKISDSYDLEIEKARQAGQDTTEIERQKTKAIQQADYEKALSDYNLKKKQDEIAKKQFERNKKIAIATALINAAVAITKAYAQDGYIYGTIEGLLITAGAAAQVAVINNQTFDSQAGDAPTPPSDSASSSSSFGGSTNSTGSSVGFNTTTTTNTGQTFRTANPNSNSGERQAPQKVYILSSEIAEALNQDKVTIERATFG